MAIIDELDTIDELLLSSENDFLEKAYQLILGRVIDPDGYIHYRGRLLQGQSRIEVLADLLNSKEARTNKRQDELTELHNIVKKIVSKNKRWWNPLSKKQVINHRISVIEKQLMYIPKQINELSKHNKEIQEKLINHSNYTTEKYIELGDLMKQLINININNAKYNNESPLNSIGQNIQNFQKLPPKAIMYILKASLKK